MTQVHILYNHILETHAYVFIKKIKFMMSTVSKRPTNCIEGDKY